MPPRYLPRPALFIVAAIVVLAQFVPLPYVAIVPGPALNVLSSAITINKAGYAPLQLQIPGKLYATTVMVSIQPRSVIYPTPVTRKAALAQGKVEMVSAEKSATLAAANFLAAINSSQAELLKSGSVKFAMKETGGPSAGLAFALALIIKVQANQLLQGRTIAVTGTMDSTGKVGPIGGIDQKLIGASKTGATIFLAPSENCQDISRTQSQWRAANWQVRGMRVIPVASLTQAVHILAAGDLRNAPHC